jgi:hypothetical protein
MPTDTASLLFAILSAVIAVSVALNSFFLRGVARRIELIDLRQRRMHDRITWLEAQHDRSGRLRLPRRRDYDTSGDHLLPSEDDGP